MTCNLTCTNYCKALVCPDFYVELSGTALYVLGSYTVCRRPVTVGPHERKKERNSKFLRE